MSWIQKNSFPLALSGITLLGVAGLFYYGTLGSTRYETAKTDYDTALAEASSIETTVPYPTVPNRDGKKKAIEDFKKDVESLQASFSAYRPGELQMVSPEKFIDRLKEVSQETRKQFELNAVVVPDGFFVGFKEYTSKFPTKSSTGILGYQLEAIRELLVVLAKSGATEVKNLHRPGLDEESGLVYQPAADAVARALPMEITFKGPERSIRRFISSLAKSESHYWVVRSLRISNMKMDPPKTADAKFNVPAARNQREAAFEDIFRFGEEGENDAPVEPVEGAQPGTESAPPAAPVPAPAPAAPAPGENRMLALILGNEELVVHIRLDLMMFHEPKPLP
jgi:hypothetical protein